MCLAESFAVSPGHRSSSFESSEWCHIIRIFVHLSIPSADYRDENTRDNTFDKVIKTIDTKTKSVGMIIVLADSDCSKCQSDSLSQDCTHHADSKSWPKRTCHKRNGMRLVKHLRLQQFVASVIAVTQIEISLFTPSCCIACIDFRVRGPGRVTWYAALQHDQGSQPGLWRARDSLFCLPLLAGDY